MDFPKVVFVIGPTGVGKSKLGIEIAKLLECQQESGKWFPTYEVSLATLIPDCSRCLVTHMGPPSHMSPMF